MGTITEVEAAPEPRRQKFRESALPKEPKTDVKVKASSGMVLRERVTRVENEHGICLLLTYTRLDQNGKVVTNSRGAAMISPVHEIVLMGELAGRGDLEAADVSASLRAGREVATARAIDFFEGMAKLPDLMASRLT